MRVAHYILRAILVVLVVIDVKVAWIFLFPTGGHFECYSTADWLRESLVLGAFLGAQLGLLWVEARLRRIRRGAKATRDGR